MVVYRLFGAWKRFDEKPLKKFLKKNKKKGYRKYYIPTRDWHIIATPEQWESRTRATINHLIEEKVEEAKKNVKPKSN